VNSDQRASIAYIIIDAVIDLEWTRKLHPAAPDEFFIQPRDIAAEVWHVAHQPRSALVLQRRTQTLRRALVSRSTSTAQGREAWTEKHAR
jgi:hypothetical protein